MAGVEAVAVEAVVAVGAGRREDTHMDTLKVLLAIASIGFISSPARAASTAPKAFPSAQAAADALVAAAGAQDVKTLTAIFGSNGKKLIVSGDEVRDRNDREKFAAQAREKLEVAPDPKDAHRATVQVGNEAWPFPVPLVEKGGAWRFESKQGLREILARRIGSNELDAIEICRGYVEAQKEYAAQDRDGDGVLEYAQRVISTDGARDGLAWRNPDGSLGGPIAEEIASAIREGYSDRKQPYHGYYFRILKRQGPSAPLGAMDYVIKGNMIGGFALVAWPAQYGISGVKTFLVSHDGVVYEKDLGRDTGAIAAKLDRFNPDKSWSAVP